MCDCLVCVGIVDMKVGGKCVGRNRRLYAISFLCYRCQQFVILFIIVTFIVIVLVVVLSCVSSVCFCMLYQPPKYPHLYCYKPVKQ